MMEWKKKSISKEVYDGSAKNTKGRVPEVGTCALNAFSFVDSFFFLIFGKYLDHCARSSSGAQDL